MIGELCPQAESNQSETRSWPDQIKHTSIGLRNVTLKSTPFVLNLRTVEVGVIVCSSNPGVPAPEIGMPIHGKDTPSIRINPPSPSDLTGKI